MQRTEVIDPHRQEVAHLHAVLVIREHRRAELIPGDENLRHQAKPLTQEDGRHNARVANRSPVSGIGPFRHGDHIARLAALHVLAVDIGCVFQRGVKHLHGRELQRARHQADSVD